MRGTACLLGRGIPCLGAVARAGCDAICPAYGAPCEACRGFHDAPNFEALGRGLLPPRAAAHAGGGEAAAVQQLQGHPGAMGKTSSIAVHHVTRVEGHGNIVIDLRDGRVTRCDLEIVESPRFFEVLLQGPPVRGGAPDRLPHLRHLLGGARDGVGAGGRGGAGRAPGPQDAGAAAAQHGRRVAPVAHPPRVLPRGPRRLRRHVGHPAGGHRGPTS